MVSQAAGLLWPALAAPEHLPGNRNSLGQHLPQDRDVQTLNRNSAPAEQPAPRHPSPPDVSPGRVPRYVSAEPGPATRDRQGRPGGRGVHKGREFLGTWRGWGCSSEEEGTPAGTLGSGWWARWAVSAQRAREAWDSVQIQEESKSKNFQCLNLKKNRAPAGKGRPGRWKEDGEREGTG